MGLSFSKYHGTGNDFVMIDNRSNPFDGNDHDYIQRLCDRRFGIGADGLILLEESDVADFSMRYFNADGHEGSMCGNGGRCVVAFARQLGIIKESASFDAIDGLHEAQILGEEVRLNMNDVSSIEKIGNDFILDTGSPHYVRLVDTFPKNLIEEAQSIRYSNAYKREGVNVNFVQVNEHAISMRTYERGVEDETYSCGTGAVAAAIVAGSELNRKVPVQIYTKGGMLQVEYIQKKTGLFTNVSLKGPVEFVFEGEIH